MKCTYHSHSTLSTKDFTNNTTQVHDLWPPSIKIIYYEAAVQESLSVCENQITIRCRNQTNVYSYEQEISTNYEMHLCYRNVRWYN